MEAFLHSKNSVDLEKIVCSMVQSLVVETALLARKTLLCLLFMACAGTHWFAHEISQPDNINILADLSTTDKRFPLGELNRVDNSSLENKDAGETDDDDDDDDEDEDDDDDNDDDQDDNDDDGEGGNDDEDDSGAEANGDGESDDDNEDDDEDDDDEDDGEEDDDEEEDDEEDEEEDQGPPSKKKK